MSSTPNPPPTDSDSSHSEEERGMDVPNDADSSEPGSSIHDQVTAPVGAVWPDVSSDEQGSQWAPAIDLDDSLGGADHTQDASGSSGAFVLDDDDAVSLPETLGGYTVGRRIGKGGMGEVYLAEHRSMGRTVALKILPTRWLDRAESVDRFYEEVKAASRLMHPNIVTAFDAGQAEGIHFLAMEYVDGRTLSQVIAEEGPMSIGDATSAIRQSALALHHAHAAGVIHRDVKPGNLMRAKDGTIKLLDLGLARFSSQWHTGSGSSSCVTTKSSTSDSAPDNGAGNSSGKPEVRRNRPLLGTLSFISPEQLEDAESADARSDQYSLGATLFYLLVGRPPFVGELIDQVYGHRHGKIPNLMTLRQDVDLTLANIVRRMMAKDPAERYGSMDEVARAMAPYDNDRSTPAWVRDFSQRQIHDEGSTAGEASRTSGSTRRSTLRVMGIELGMTHAATAVTGTDGAARGGWPGRDANGPKRLIRLAAASKTSTRNDRAHSILFGDQAYELRQSHPRQVAHCQLMYVGRRDTLRQLAGRMCPPEVNLAMCLRNLVGRTLVHHQNPSPDDVAASFSSVLGPSWQRHESWPDAIAITVPGCYDQMHRRAIHLAAKLAGLSSVRLIDRSVAIARAAQGGYVVDGLRDDADDIALDSQVSSSTDHDSDDESGRHSRSETMLYVGLTGQALDIAVLRCEDQTIHQASMAGHWHHSSMAWSRRLVGLIAKRLVHAPSPDRSAARDPKQLLHAAKIQVAGERAMNSLLLLPETKVQIEHDGHVDEVVITRQEWLAACEDLIVAIEQGILTACRRASVSRRSVHRLLATGPILRLAPIRDRIMSSLGETTSVDFFDRQDAARGAAACVAAELPGNRRSEFSSQSSAANAIGFLVSDRSGKRKIMPIIPRGTTLPARTNRQLSGTAKDNQMKLSLVESSGPEGDNWQTLGRHVIDVESIEAHPTRRLGFEIDINGLLSVHLERPDLGRTVILPPLPEPAISTAQWGDWQEWIADQV